MDEGISLLYAALPEDSSEINTYPISLYFVFVEGKVPVNGSPGAYWRSCAG